MGDVVSELTCEARQLVSGVLLTTPTYDVTFGDVIESECPDDGRDLLMSNGMRVDRVKCTAHGRQGMLSVPQVQRHACSAFHSRTVTSVSEIALCV